MMTTMPLSQADHALSMRVSPRARTDTNNQGLRSMLVHRLRPTAKAVWRWGLTQDTSSLYCERCRRWTALNDEPEPVVTCQHCSRRFEVEFVVYSAIKEDA